MDDFTVYTMGIYDEREKWKKKIADIIAEINKAYEEYDGYDPNDLFRYSLRVEQIIRKHCEKEQNND